MMFERETFGFSIARPLAEVYEFLLEPTNFAKWAFVGDSAMRHLGGQDWAVETSVGPRIIRFATRNGFGVLDHAILRHEGDTPHPTGMRTVANGAGTELIYTNFKRHGWTEAEWTSAKHWVVSDLLALQSMLDARGPVSPLLAAHTVSYSIARPMRDVFEFILEPANFSKWGFAGDVELTRINADEWAAETSVGRRILTFPRRNDFGVLDYRMRLAVDGPQMLMPMRVQPNGDGAELIYTFLQRPGSSDEEWQSVIEWFSTDLVALKSMLEA